MARCKSRPARWAEAVSNLQSAVDEITSAKDALEEAKGELVALREEYEEWYEGMPENFQEGETGSKIQELLNLEDPEGAVDEIVNAIDTIESLVGEYEAADLPLGFGRD